MAIPILDPHLGSAAVYDGVLRELQAVWHTLMDRSSCTRISSQITSTPSTSARSSTRSVAQDSVTDALQFTLPEMATHAFLTALFLINGQWVATLINLPLVIYNANK